MPRASRGLMRGEPSARPSLYAPVPLQGPWTPSAGLLGATLPSQLPLLLACHCLLSSPWHAACAQSWPQPRVSGSLSVAFPKDPLPCSRHAPQALRGRAAAPAPLLPLGLSTGSVHPLSQPDAARRVARTDQGLLSVAVML